MIAPVLLATGFAFTLGTIAGDWLRKSALEMFTHDAGGDRADALGAASDVPVHSSVNSSGAQRDGI